MARKRVAILISGRGSNMAALIEAAKDADYPAEIALVVSNRPDAAGLARAREAGDRRPRSSITPPTARIAPPSSAILHAVLETHRIELVCLAGFMRLLTPWFVGKLGRAHAQHPSGAACRPSRVSTPMRARSRRA